MAKSMQNRNLVGMIADDETITGFALTGIFPHRTKSTAIQADLQTTTNELKMFFDELYSREDIAMILVADFVFSKLKEHFKGYQNTVPCYIEIPSKIEIWVVINPIVDYMQRKRGINSVIDAIIKDRLVKSSSSDLSVVTEINIAVTDKKLYTDPEEDDIIISSISRQNEIDSSAQLTVNVQNNENRNYIPKFRSGGFAILKTLGENEGITCKEICDRAKVYCDADFDLGQRYSAWSSMKSLVSKGLVVSDGVPKRYYLTEVGINISDRLPSCEVPDIDNEVKLLIDCREMKNRKTRNFFQEELTAHNIKIDTRALEVGDFLWAKGEYILDYIIERKKGSDFVSSIVDGRLQEQHNRLEMLGMSNIFYIIEGLKHKNLVKVGVNRGSGLLSSLKLKNTTVIETENLQETIFIIRKLNDLVIKRMDEGDSKMIRYSEYAQKSKKCLNEVDFGCRLFFSVRGLTFVKASELSKKYKGVEGFLSESKNKNFFTDLSDFMSIGKTIAKRICELLGVEINT